MWEELGGEGFISMAEWPKYDEEKTIDKTIEIPVQINGKTKAVLSIAADEAKDVVLAKAKELI